MKENMTREQARKYFTGKVEPQLLEEFLDRLFSGQSLLTEACRKRHAEEIKPLLEAWKREGRIS